MGDMSILRTYENYLKQEKKFKKNEEAKMTASSATGSGLLAPRRVPNKNSRNDKNDQASAFKSVYDTVQAIRNRKV
jgi:hypothetical protein